MLNDVSQDSRLFSLIHLIRGCEEILTELSGENAVDFCLDHTPF